MYIYIYTYLHTYIHTYIHKHTYIYTYIHTYISQTHTHVVCPFFYSARKRSTNACMLLEFAARAARAYVSTDTSGHEWTQSGHEWTQADISGHERTQGDVSGHKRHERT